MRRDKEDERKNRRNTLRYFEYFFTKSDEVAAYGSFAAVGFNFASRSKYKNYTFLRASTPWINLARAGSIPLGT